MSASASPRSGTPVAPQSRSENELATAARSSVPNNQAPPTVEPPKTTFSLASGFVPSWRRPMMNATGVDGIGARRPSVQFVPASRESGSRSSSATPGALRSKSHGDRTAIRPGAAGRRLSSPPPPAQFRPSVSFDTFSNPSASDFSLTLNRKHKEYVYTKRSRTFLCGTDTNEYSDTALEWLIDELVDDGDEVVCLRVVEKDSKEATRWSGGQGEKGYREEAHRFLEAIERKNTDDRAISLVLEFSIGKVHDTIQQMIRIYEPAILVVGTRGRSLTGYQGLLSSGSVSKYCLQYSPVPVIVVRPSSKREAKKRKRQQDPTRSGYRDILDKTEDTHGGRGGHLLDATNRTSLFGADLGALGEFGSAGNPDDEARRVAEAIGWPGNGPSVESGPRSSSRRASVRSDASDLQSPPGTGRLLMSPELGTNDSPERESEDEDEDEYDGMEEYVRPQDEAAMKAYEQGIKNAEEVREGEAARLKREQERRENRNQQQQQRGRKRNEEEGEGGGAAVLGLLAQLDRGMR